MSGKERKRERKMTFSKQQRQFDKVSKIKPLIYLSNNLNNKA